MGGTDFELEDKPTVEQDGSPSPPGPPINRRFVKDEAVLAKFGKRQQLRVSTGSS